MKQMLFFLFQLLGATMIGAQPAIQWAKTYGGNGFESANFGQQTNDGGYIVTGETIGSTDGDVPGTYGSTDAWLVKTDDLGGIQWQKTFGGTDKDIALRVYPISGGGYVLGGHTQSCNGDMINSHGMQDIWLFKLDSIGGIVWQKGFGGSKDEALSDLKPCSDGGFVILGSTFSNDFDVSGNHGDLDMWVIKLTASGDIQWQKCLGGTSEEAGAHVLQTTDEGFILSGYTRSNDGDVGGNHGFYDVWVVKLDKMGNIQWTRNLGGSGTEFGGQLIQTVDEGYTLVGMTNSTDGDITDAHGDFDVWVLKLSATGALIWQHTFGGPSNEVAYTMTDTEDGGYTIAGSIYPENTPLPGDLDIWVFKINQIGDLVWQRTLGGTGWEAPSSIQQTMDGGLFVTGKTDSNNGDVSGNHGLVDGWVVKLSPESVANNDLPVILNTLEIYPNPARNFLAIQLHTGSLPLQLCVMDLTGKVVLGPFTPLDPILDISALSDGFYLLSAMNAAGYGCVKKFVKCR